jgi:putative ABC transport system permease protein
MALSYSTATSIATRELRSSRGKFAFVVLSVAIGVAALTGVRGFSSSFRAMLTLHARSIMAGDLAARTTQQATPEEQAGLDKIAAEGTEATQVIELNSMASSPITLDPLLVSVKAVDPTKYPFYGTVDLIPALAPGDSLAKVLTLDTVAVADDLLIRLHLKLGDSIKLGNAIFRIVATVENEPDRLTGTFAAGPRVLLSLEALDHSGLLAYGSHATRRYLFKMPLSQPGKASSDAAVAAMKARLEALLPEAQVTDYREANPNLTSGLDNATSLLSLMSLIALVLGAVGVAMAMRAHLQQRLDTIAIMKSLGAQSGQVMRIYLIQTLLIAIIGGVLGVVLGFGVQLAFPLFLAKLLHITPGFRVDMSSIAVGLATGLVTTLLFTLPPLLDIRGVRPILILRRAVEDTDDPFAARLLKKLRGNLVQIGAVVLILVGLIFLAAGISGSARVGIVFSLFLAMILLILLGMSALTLYLLGLFLRGTRLHLPSVLRHGLANLYRPGNPSAALLAALGLGVMLVMGVYFIQETAVKQLQITTAAKLPNMFLIDISPSEVAGVRALLAAQPSVKGEPELIPVVGSRLIAFNGTPAAELRPKGIRSPDEPPPSRENNARPRGVMMRNLNLTWGPAEDAPPPGDKIIEGKWWSAAEAANSAAHPLVAIGKFQALRLGAHPGDTITLAAQDSQFTATIAAIYEADSQHAYSRAEFVLPEPVLHGLPVIWYGGVHCDPNATSVLQRALYAAYPTITVISVAATLEVVRQVILQITYVIQFLAAFSIFAGIVILASAIAGTRYRRIREVVVLKTLGATRARIAAIFSIEFGILGLVAATVGLAFANLGASLFIHYVLKIDYHFQPGLTLFALTLTALFTVAAGWLASHRVLGQKPLEVLREE